MSFNGTIGDFGVAEIFQLVGGQAKTGTLLLQSDVDQVRVFFKEGVVTGAERAKQPAHRQLGQRMVRAEVITQEQLDAAVEEQKRGLMRLGKALMDIGAADAATVQQLATLETTETIYSLFEWSFGSYEFEVGEVEDSPEGVPPMRTDSVVLNGLRYIDEWPAIRTRIPSFDWQVERMRALPAEGVDPKITKEARRVYALSHKAPTVNQIIDLSRLGRFEVCEALAYLQEAGYVRVLKPDSTDERAAPKTARRMPAVRWVWLGRACLSAALVFGAALILWAQLGGGRVQTARYRPDPVRARLANGQLRVIRRALEVYRHQSGDYPERLEQLVEGGFLSERDLRFPYQRRYAYEREGDGVLLLRPLR